MTMDSLSHSIAFDAGDSMPADSAGAAAPVAPKKRGRPAKVAAPSPTVFAQAMIGKVWLAVAKDDDACAHFKLFDGATSLEVIYNGPSDRTLIPALRANKWRWPNEETLAHDVPAFPVPVDNGLTLDSDKVRDALAHLASAMSTDITRHNLAGLYLDPAGVWVTTDGHRMHTVTGMDSPCPEGRIVPRHAIITLQKLIKATKAEGVTIGWNPRAPRMLHFMLLGNTLRAWYSVECVDAQFPEWRNVVPSTEGVPTFVGDAAGVRAAFDAAPVIGDRNVARRLEFTSDGAATYRHDKVAVRLPLEGSGGLSASYNARYLDAAFAEMDGAVSIFAPDEYSPMRIDNGARMVIVMPMRA